MAVMAVHSCPSVWQVLAVIRKFPLCDSPVTSPQLGGTDAERTIGGITEKLQKPCRNRIYHGYTGIASYIRRKKNKLIKLVYLKYTTF